MKDKYIRLKALLLAGSMVLTSSTLTGCGNKSNKVNESQAIVMQGQTKHFGIGEHIISVPVEIPTANVKQYTYHEGYKVVGIATSYAAYTFNGACVVYENEYPVECMSSGTNKDGIPVYENFGQPADFFRDETSKTSSTKDFNAGEHIISVPIKNPNFKVMQYEYHEGYEVVGIATSNASYSFSGACILYVNTQPVTCALSEYKDNEELYLSFGVPIEKDKTRTLE